MTRVGVVALGWWFTATGCYQPSPAADQPCSETNRCPHGLVCDLGSLTCVSALPDAARFATIDAGYDHTCAIDPAGELWCWGGNGAGQLGIGSARNQPEPTQVIGGAAWQTVSAGYYGTCGIRIDGTLWCWGFGSTTGLGDRDEPTRLEDPAVGPWAAVAVGYEGFCALTTGGALYCRWSQGGVPSPPSLQDTTAITGIQQMSASAGHQCVIDQAGQLHCWGTNNFGEVGNGSTDAVVLAPAQVRPGTTWAGVTVGDNVVCAIASDATLWCWGECAYNQTGQGQGPSTGCRTPDRVGSDTYRSVGVGNEHTCAVRGDGAMVCFGANEFGQLGDLGGDLDELGPLVMRSIDQFEVVTAGDDHNCALRAGGEAWCWGYSRDGELGDGTGGLVLEPVRIAEAGVEAVSVGITSTCAIHVDRTLRCWGQNARGQLGDGTTFQRHRPVQIGTDADWTAVANGFYHTCGLRDPGTLWCWGSNADDQLGIRGGDQPRPSQVGTDTDWTAIGAAELTTCGVRAGRLYCWGRDIDAVPFALDAATTWTTVGLVGLGQGLQGSQMCAINAGALYCFSDADVPTTPSDAMILDWQSFTLGWNHGCGLTPGGAARCLGENESGQLGLDLFGGSAATGTLVLGGLTWQAIEAGDAATCGIAVGGELYCWGLPDVTGLGEGAVAVALPSVVLAGSQWRAIGVGHHHSCGIQVDGSLWCWGVSDFGERGDGGGGTDRAVRVKPPIGP